MSRTDTTGTTRYTYDPSGLPVSERTPGGTYYFLFDGLANVAMLVDASGNVVAMVSPCPTGNQSGDQWAKPGTNALEELLFQGGGARGVVYDAGTVNLKTARGYLGANGTGWTKLSLVETIGGTPVYLADDLESPNLGDLGGIGDLDGNGGGGGIGGEGGGVSELPSLPPPSRLNPWKGPTFSVVLDQEVDLYRVWGGESPQVGAFLTVIRPTTASEARANLALPPWNTAQYISEATVPAGTRMQYGTAGPNWGQPGGWPQVELLDQIPASSFGPGVPLPP
jgi:YD repeat-containing protein